MTISSPPHQLHSLSHTYPITLGHNGDSHEEVEEKFASELLSFGCGESMDVYHGAQQCDVCDHLELFVSLQDQPERQSANYIMLGTSSYTARWGLVLDFVSVASGIPACKNYLKFMLRHSSTRHIASQCRDCVNWYTDVDSGLLDFPHPDHYPVDHIKPQQAITASILRKMRKLAGSNHIDQAMSQLLIGGFYFATRSC